MKTHSESLVEYLNDPPVKTEAYEALRVVALYLAAKETKDIALEAFLNLMSAHGVFTSVLLNAFKKSQPELGPFVGGTSVSLEERWKVTNACLYPAGKAKLTGDESAALSLFFYIHQEQEDRILLKNRWRPRLRICASPKCGRFVYDTSVNRSRRTCSAKCRMARLRAR